MIQQLYLDDVMPRKESSRMSCVMLSAFFDTAISEAIL
jgi:hypothetical protein